MGEQEAEFAAFLRLLDECGCLEHVIVVGSWAELVYGRAGLLEGFDPNIRTMDIDFLIRNLRRPVPSASLAAVARRAGYLVSSDRLNGITKIYDKKGLEIEFLIGKVGAGLEPALKTNLGVTAQTLWHMDILSRGMLTVNYLGLEVNVPRPEAYAVHKMVINSERGVKAKKDALAVVRIWPYLDREALSGVMDSLSRKERNRALAIAELHSLSFKA